MCSEANRGPRVTVYALRLPGDDGLPLVPEPPMAQCRRSRRQGRQYAAAVLKGTVVQQPTAERLPDEKEDYCHLVIDVMGRHYHADAYGSMAKACCRLRTGSKVVVVCDLLQHRIDAPGVEHPHKLALGVRRAKLLAQPRRGLR